MNKVTIKNSHHVRSPFRHTACYQGKQAVRRRSFVDVQAAVLFVGCVDRPLPASSRQTSCQGLWGKCWRI
jgi:hypothetical protein